MGHWLSAASYAKRSVPPSPVAAAAGDARASQGLAVVGGWRCQGEPGSRGSSRASTPRGFPGSGCVFFSADGFSARGFSLPLCSFIEIENHAASLSAASRTLHFSIAIPPDAATLLRDYLPLLKIVAADATETTADKVWLSQRRSTGTTGTLIAFLRNGRLPPPIPPPAPPPPNGQAELYQLDPSENYPSLTPSFSSRALTRRQQAKHRASAVGYNAATLRGGSRVPQRIISMRVSIRDRSRPPRSVAAL